MFTSGGGPVCVVIGLVSLAIRRARSGTGPLPPSTVAPPSPRSIASGVGKSGPAGDGRGFVGRAQC